MCKYTVAIFRHSRRGSQISLQMVWDTHVVAGIWTQDLWKISVFNHWAISPGQSFVICKYTVAVFRHTRWGHQISLQMVVSHHVVARSWPLEEQSVILTAEPSLQPENRNFKAATVCVQTCVCMLVCVHICVCACVCVCRSVCLWLNSASSTC